MRRTAPITLIVFISLSGCGSKEKTGDMNAAVADFNSGRYAQSREAANQAMNTSTGTAKDEATYLAGLSAYQLGDTDEAERRWIVSANSSNEETAANSKAMLGQLKLDQNRPREAAELLSDAATHLQGEDAKQAAHRAGLAYQEAGDQANAQKWLAMGGQSSAFRQTATASSSSLSKSSPNSKPVSAASPNGYALQVGAFNEISRARRAAQDAERLAKKQGVGPVKMFSKHDDRGRRFFIVQLGNFTTRDEATAARTKLGKLEYIVAPAAAKVNGYASAG